MVINITGWGAFWLMIAAVAFTSLIVDAIVKTSQVRQIVKLIDKAIENGMKDDDDNISDSVRNLIDKLNK